MRVHWKKFVELGAITVIAASTIAGCSDNNGGDDPKQSGGMGGTDATGGKDGTGGTEATGGKSNSTGGKDQGTTGGADNGTGGTTPVDELQPVTVGPRPYFLLDSLESGTLKDELLTCAEGPFEKSTFSIGHRGAALQFPEHTKESYEAASRMGAGIIECDVTFTKDKELVCRHSQCDLHTTTDILLHPALAAKCSVPFSPADGDTPASAQCCTSDITLTEYQTLCGKMDGANSKATTAEDYVKGTADFRTDLYSTCGTLLTHAESIELIEDLGSKFTPELKSPSVTMPFDGFSQEDYAQKMIDEYKDAGIPASDVWAQSFNVDDVYYWLENEADFGKQAVFLDDVNGDADIAAAIADLTTMKGKGVKIVAPPLWALVTVKDGKVVPSDYAKAAKAEKLDIITWSLERSGPLASGGGWYFQSIASETTVDGDYFKLLDVLAKDVGIIGIFSDWPGTSTYYANCMGLGVEGKLATPQPIQLGPRPAFLVDKMESGALKDELLECIDAPQEKSDFSIGHRGAALQFPEHTKESYEAASRMGAGIIECDVTFTKDKELVCRHSQCDLHTTTDILLHPALAAKCSVPFSPADGDTPASAQCCTSDITLAEYQTLCGKMDGANSKATTAEDYVKGTADFRTDLYSTCGTLLTHAESIELIEDLGSKFTPELKSPSVTMPFDGLSQEDYAQKMIDEYKDAGIPASDVWAQSFNVDDVYYWLENEADFGKQAVFLDDVNSDADIAAAIADLTTMKGKGVKIVAPPLWALVTVKDGKVVPSDYAKAAKAEKLDIITWSLERSGPLASGGGWYFQSIASETTVDGDYFKLLDVLAKDVGIIGIFSDWPATTTYYANCMDK